MSKKVLLGITCYSIPGPRVVGESYCYFLRRFGQCPYKMKTLFWGYCFGGCFFSCYISFFIS